MLDVLAAYRRAVAQNRSLYGALPMERIRAVSWISVADYLAYMIVLQVSADSQPPPDELDQFRRVHDHAQGRFDRLDTRVHIRHGEITRPSA